MARVRGVNTTDIRDAIRLGCRTMASVFNADDHDLPYFGSQVRPDPRLSGGGLSDAHVPGWRLNALLNAEDAAGVDLDAAAVAKHARAALFSYSGEPAWSPDGDRLAFAAIRDGDIEIFLMNVDGIGGTRVTHSNGYDLWPQWSPDGRYLAFASDRDGDVEI